MAENLKYFTPEIEDLRVGYECEQSFITTYDSGTKSERVEESWMPVIIQHIHNHQHPKIQNPVYRTPYLTKEQIEAEGWNSYEGNSKFFWKNGFTFSKQENPLGEFEDNEGNTLFYGQCKDINTFRYICKLLNI